MSHDQPGDPADPTFTFAEALSREYRAIWSADRTFASADEHTRHVLADSHPKQAALCLSGGGVRSAAFALGVLQSLARQGLLQRFHYLSTVSGGGYIGGWLQAWIRAAGRDGSTDPVAEVQAGLCRLEPRPVDVLRNFTSYLAPHAGLASPDVWTGFVLVLRNIAVNWVVFGPALFAVALLPACYAAWLTEIPVWLGWALLGLGFVALGLSVAATASRLPSHVAPGRPYAEPAEITRQMVVPGILFALLLPLALRAKPIPAGPALWVVPAVTFAVLLLGYGVAWLRCRYGSALFRRNLPAWIAACAVACLVLLAGLAVAPRLAAGIGLWTTRLPGEAMLAVFGPAWVMLAQLSLHTCFVALRQEALRGDLDREWLARLSASKIVPVLLWSGFCAVCLLLSPLLLGADRDAFFHWATGLVTAVAGLVARSLGKSASTPATGANPGTAGGGLSADRLALAATAVFGLGLFVLLSAAGRAALAGLSGGLPAGLAAPGVTAPGVTAPGLAALSFGLAWLLGGWVNINRFSLHGIYRNRLARAFLGSGRETRDGERHRLQDPFTQFDPADNPRVHELLTKGGPPRRLFPVIGTALNLVSGAPAAWAERKAAPFSITPVACGSESLPPPPGQDGGRFVDPSVFGGREMETGVAASATGISLGTAIAISGAAVSPNMGYHSSPTTAFLLTLFNVRLGVWLPNPARVAGAALRDAKPPNVVRALADEMLGRTGYDKPAIYLSDGGHFDNLGLYEMIRRGCRLIVVVDAGEDATYAYRDLADALRKVRIDQRVDIDFTTPLPMTTRAAWKSGVNRAFALATITWPNQRRDGPGATGHLLYLKPCLFDGLPLDVLSYAGQNAGFPHDTTTDQFFTESQFESYRQLGLSIGDLLRAEHGSEVADFLGALAGATAATGGSG